MGSISFPWRRRRLLRLTGGRGVDMKMEMHRLVDLPTQMEIQMRGLVQTRGDERNQTTERATKSSQITCPLRLPMWTSCSSWKTATPARNPTHGRDPPCRHQRRKITILPPLAVITTTIRIGIKTMLPVITTIQTARSVAAEFPVPSRQPQQRHPPLPQLPTCPRPCKPPPRGKNPTPPLTVNTKKLIIAMSCPRRPPRG
mmetsp:Transcript_11411/g.24028  ORF Transcript_11411/g.24028 Transcript_11411/m.24028 type:complete len:200 (+) Transcript_11411:136-735(+)